MKCKNCGHIVSDKFCSKCGQNSRVSRINFPSFIEEISEGLFQINKGFFYTLRELTIRPGNSLKEFLNGKRKYHFKPIAYVLTLSTLYFLISQATGQNTWLDDIITGWMNGATGKSSDVEIPQIVTWLTKSFAYTTVLLLPVFSLASYVSFYKFGKNYLEHIVLNSYITGHQALFYSLCAIIGMTLKNDVIAMISFFTAVLYTFWVYGQLFSEGRGATNFLRSILTYVLYLVFSFILLGALAGLTEW